ncbi:hypothetical protein U472_14650 [Orenia metallireducens]|uniref:Glycosyltransferase 2-like domain-containing protein n=1 Tax=Orenia metallireducens TaxID=1413210 RepID=A0A1C0A605_9FIRM|nr:glycosyltransferase family 2 protein [Orenia metallireducens]OCL25568.1 hypothetical protein U472_14650 [Orenia metallireducens]
MYKREKSLVSVIIPTYRRPDKLDDAINSVMQQTYNNWELLIIDDNNEGSEYRQETEKFMKSYTNNKKINYIKHKENQGGSAARNTGIKNSRGEYIAFLDDDDKWDFTKLEKMVNKIKDISEDYGVCFSSYYIITEKGTFKESQPKAQGNIYKKQLLKDHVGPTSTVLVKSTCFKKVGGFDESLPARQDYDMWIRISEHYKFIYMDEPLVYIYRKNRGVNDAISSNYMYNLKGTEIILDKLKEKIKKYDIRDQKEIYSSQYNYLGKMCCNLGNFRLGKIYLFKSLSYKFKNLLLLLLAILGSSTWNFIKNLIKEYNIKIS